MEISSTVGMMLLLGVISLSMMVITLPMIERRVKPNLWYGFRTRKTLNDERLWYDVNAYAGRRLFVVGMINTLALVAGFFVPALRDNVALYSLAFLLVCCIGMFWAISSSMGYMNSL